MAVIKKYAEPLLEAVPREARKPYMIARRLLRLLKNVKSMEDDVIPNNSLLREFIGGSVFKEAL
jgi:uridine kinase